MDKERTLGVIIKPDLESNMLKISSFAMLEREKAKPNENDIYGVLENQSFYNVVSGEYEGFSEEDFNELVFWNGDNPFDYSEDNELRILNYHSINNEMMYVFDPKYIEKYAQEKNLSFDYACLDIAKHCCYYNIVMNSKYKDIDFGEVYNNNIIPNNRLMSNYDLIKMLGLDKKEKDEFIEETDISIKDKVNNMFDEISKIIVLQDDAIKTLITNIFYNQLLIDDLSKNPEIDPVELDSRKVSILVDGTTGTGKTAIIKSIAYRLNLPITKWNATSFSEVGYVGASLTEILRDLYKNSGKNIKKAERGIVILDEIDKLCIKDDSNVDMKKGVQRELLGFISGGKYVFPLEDNKAGSPIIEFDTSKLTFIFLGAFTNIRDRKIKEAKKIPLGFGPRKDEDEEYNTYVITSQDYIDEGLERELFGRVRVLTGTNSYSLDDLKYILCTSSDSPLINLDKTVKMCGYSGITYTEEIIDVIAEEAFKMDTGARGLQTVVSGIQNILLPGLYNQDYDLDKPIEITTDLVNAYNKSLVRKFYR